MNKTQLMSLPYLPAPHVITFYSSTGADPGMGAPGPPPPLNIGKNMIFWRKIVIFHTKYPNIFRASLRNRKKYDFLA
jgi:hypothetical protein